VFHRTSAERWDGRASVAPLQPVPRSGESPKSRQGDALFSDVGRDVLATGFAASDNPVGGVGGTAGPVELKPER
jgi:hypothetical protein